MCVGGMVIVGFVCVVYGVGGDEIGEFMGLNFGVWLVVVFDVVIEVVGFVLNDEVWWVYWEYEWQELVNYCDEC